LALKLHPDKNGAPGADEARKKKNTILTSDHRFMDHVSCIVTTSNVLYIRYTYNDMQISTRKIHILLQIPQQETKLLAYI